VRATLAAPHAKAPKFEWHPSIPSGTHSWCCRPIPQITVGVRLYRPLARPVPSRMHRQPLPSRARYFPTARDMSLAYSPLPLASPSLPFLWLPLAVPEAPSYVRLVLVLGSVTLILGKGRMETTVDDLSMAYDDFMAPSHDHRSSWAPTHVRLVWSWTPTVLGCRSDEELPVPSPRPSLPSR
jgi:hypothetical protein